MDIALSILKVRIESETRVRRSFVIVRSKVPSPRVWARQRRSRWNLKYHSDWLYQVGLSSSFYTPPHPPKSSPLTPCLVYSAYLEFSSCSAPSYSVSWRQSPCLSWRCSMLLGFILVNRRQLLEVVVSRSLGWVLFTAKMIRMLTSYFRRWSVRCMVRWSSFSTRRWIKRAIYLGRTVNTIPMEIGLAAKQVRLWMTYCTK